MFSDTSRGKLRDEGGENSHMLELVSQGVDGRLLLMTSVWVSVRKFFDK